MTEHLRYLRYVLLHKLYVARAGRSLGLTLRAAIVHDLSKFSRAEWGPYRRRFFSGRAGVEDKSGDPGEFKRAWEHHWTHNPHHWEYWRRNDLAARMPREYVVEMVADWLGAGRGITGSWDLSDWYVKTRERRVLHPDTLADVEELLASVDYGRAL